MTVVENAYAKINLYLDVTGKRDDGFHDILSVMHSVSLSDTITVSSEICDKTSITISCDKADLPTNEDNIVYRTVEEYLSYFNLRAKTSVVIDKRIPIGAGLGGGSSDAAATLRALNKIFQCGTSNDLQAIAEKLGSDVPFCLFGGLYLCSGRGEILNRLDSGLAENFVVAIGDTRVSTPRAYAELDQKFDNFVNYKGNELYRQMIADLEREDGVSIPLYNIFQHISSTSEIDKIKEIMTKNGAEYTLMSGSGPSVFARFANSNSADTACKALCDVGYTAFSCHSVYPEVTI